MTQQQLVRRIVSQMKSLDALLETNNSRRFLWADEVEIELIRQHRGTSLREYLVQEYHCKGRTFEQIARDAKSFSGIDKDRTTWQRLCYALQMPIRSKSGVKTEFYSEQDLTTVRDIASRHAIIHGKVMEAAQALDIVVRRVHAAASTKEYVERNGGSVSVPVLEQLAAAIREEVGALRPVPYRRFDHVVRFAAYGIPPKVEPAPRMTYTPETYKLAAKHRIMLLDDPQRKSLFQWNKSDRQGFYQRVENALRAEGMADSLPLYVHALRSVGITAETIAGSLMKATRELIPTSLIHQMKIDFNLPDIKYHQRSYKAYAKTQDSHDRHPILL